MYFKFVILFITFVAAAASESDCYSCAKENYGRNFMCYSKGIYANPYSISCCAPNSNDENCNAAKADTLCSKPYNED